MPAPASGVDTTWYSMDIAGVHWITLSNYHDFTSGSPQYNWLKSDLAAIDRSTTPWVFVNTHAPWRVIITAGRFIPPPSPSYAFSPHTHLSSTTKQVQHQ